MKLRKLNKRGGIGELVTGIPALIIIIIVLVLFIIGSSVYDSIKEKSKVEVRYGTELGAGDVLGYMLGNELQDLVSNRVLLAQGKSLEEVFGNG